MKRKYHVNEATGKVGRCSAKPGNCPLKDSMGNEPEHYFTRKDARAGYENTMSEENFSTLSKNVENNKIYKDSEKRNVSNAVYSMEDVSVGKRVKKNMFDPFSSDPTNMYEEEVWFQHNGVNIGFVHIQREKVFWEEDKQEIPLDLAREKDVIDEENDNYFTVLCDIEVRNAGANQGVFVVKKLQELYGDIFLTGGCTPAGYKFISKNKELFKQVPGHGKTMDIYSDDFEAVYKPQNFVSHWDKAEPEFPL